MQKRERHVITMQDFYAKEVFMKKKNVNLLGLMRKREIDVITMQHSYVKEALIDYTTVLCEKRSYRLYKLEKFFP